ncbi:MAG: Copper binding protein [Cenarchaeum symbiont of Oopsacas minuta]|nr:Copper binding protein [Cenarchaeum symbiont of Oopsacas minuta]
MMSKFEIGLASVMGVLVLGILALIIASPDSIPSGISTPMMEMAKEPVVEEMIVEDEIEMMNTDEKVVMANNTTLVSIPSGSGIPVCAETNECFIPFKVEIISGGTVTWSNDDVAAHTVTSGTPSDDTGNIFDSGLFIAGSTFEHTFDDFGTYDYFCLVHPWMIGTVHVQ